MKTHTVLVTPEEDPVVVCNLWEQIGWQVRQIVMNPISMHVYVVFEGDDSLHTLIDVVPAPAPKTLTVSALVESPHLVTTNG